jgi:hypothetical protein
MNNKARRLDQIPRSAIKAKPVAPMAEKIDFVPCNSNKHEILWDRFKLKYGGHRTWITVKTMNNEIIKSWITLREIMRIMEEGYDKEKAEADSTKTE